MSASAREDGSARGDVFPSKRTICERARPVRRAISSVEGASYDVYFSAMGLTALNRILRRLLRRREAELAANPEETISEEKQHADELMYRSGDTHHTA
jgi:hypothetical protein